MTGRFDILILGGGNAGFGVSAIAAEVGKRIAFVEERDFGGTCPNRGCTPKKVLVAAAHALQPGVRVLARDPEREQALLQRLAAAPCRSWIHLKASF